MKIINISSKKQPISKGIYGKYFQISKRNGVKILGRGYKKIDSIFKKYKTLADAELESMILKKAERSKISPKRAQAVIVKYKNLYYPAIKMQHIYGKTLYQIDPYLDLNNHYVTKQGRFSANGQFKLGKFVRDCLKRVGIINKDLHLNNVIINNQGKVKVIDFSPEWIQASISL